MEHLSLYELQQRIKSSLETAFPLPVWIVAEISELKVNYSGHCYLELIEKDNADSVKIKAKVNANIWGNKFRLLKTYFETTTRIGLTEGLKVLIKVDVRFHEIYGLSLNIVDIDPAFTVGEMKLQRNLVIQRLMEEGIIDLNKEFDLPKVPQRIAVVSSASAAGYQDFCNQLMSNAFGYTFLIELFPSVMQGNEAELSIVASLEAIFRRLEDFDLVAIIRGGGSQNDLACFDSYNIAANVAQFPLPVITGIGHDKDESVTDIVARTSFKTPTAAAAFLIDMVAEFEDELLRCAGEISYHARNLIQEQRMATMDVEFHLLDCVKTIVSDSKFNLDSLVYGISKGVRGKLLIQQRFVDSYLNRVDKATVRLINAKTDNLVRYKNAVLSNAKLRMMEQSHYLENLLVRIESSSPQEILKKGYSLTLFEGKIVRDVSELKGKELETLLESGRVVSAVKEVENINPLIWQKKS
ncbi:exodeoxyribonuclease VII large subunit [Alistipes sp. ZOR0009]|uniref:exodeoxyribonuclease VII large subunit n=1 Tax=Alistipes sp. ZOR0009 TaxID=1339253 RepID=UPI0006491987|nr:exodeoxyribonuclease VII large subunit [Alistipes sp. ZOR0009]